MRVLTSIILSTAILLPISATGADNEETKMLALNVGLTTGLTGNNIEVSKTLNDYLSLRADMHISGSIERSSTIEDNQYSMNFTPDTKSLLLDIRPFSGIFYVTGGLVNQNINITLTGKAKSGTYTFNDQSYNTDDIGSFTGTLGFSKTTAPYLGMGWSNRNKATSGLAFSLEAGVIEVGTGNIKLKVACAANTICSDLAANVKAETDKANKELSSKLYYPVVKLGISYRF